MRVPTPEQIAETKAQIARLAYGSPGNSGTQGVPYHEIYFKEFRDTSSRRLESQDWLDALLAAIEVRDKVIIDLGCNVGYFCFGLAEAGARTFGIDYDSDSIELASTLKEMYGISNVSFQRSKITKAALKEWVDREGFPDVILLNSVIHWLLHSHDTFDSALDALSPLFSDSKPQAIVYEPSSTGAAYFPELLQRTNIEKFFTSCAALDWKKIGSFSASNAGQEREYYLGIRNVPDLQKLSVQGLEPHVSEESLLGATISRTRKNGKLRLCTRRFYIKSHDEGDVLAQALLENEARMVRLFSSSHAPFLVWSGYAGNRTILVYRREIDSQLAGSLVSASDVALLDREISSLLRDLEQSRIIHNDITPENLLWNVKGKSLRLIDFEFAAPTGEASSLTLLDYFLSLAPGCAGQIISCLDDLGGSNRFARGLGGFDCDRYAAKSILYSIKDRKRYYTKRARQFGVGFLTRCYRRIVPQSLRQTPRVEGY